MPDTISYKEVANWWNGKVIIREIKTFSDKRGMVCEVFRTDSEIMKNSKMCYISETESYIMRGPHSHLYQQDEFFTWDAVMSYHMYNPETKEMNVFITERGKIYNVFVEVGIVHSYRNLDKDKSFTLNFPTSLFMGQDKKESIDEIRHEDKYENNDVIVIFGAAGRLGKAITNEFFKNMKEHSYDVIPSYEKLHNKEEVLKLFSKLDLAIGKNRNVYFINCAALTNVQDVNTLDQIWEWSNVDMPLHFAKECNGRTWRFIQFSTDYVFQKVEENIFGYNLSAYTRSKIQMEKSLISPGLENVNIVRIANLYDITDETDSNFIAKVKKVIKEKGSIKVDPRLMIFPSNVRDIAKEIYGFYSRCFFNLNKTVNMIPSKSYFIKDFVFEFFKAEQILENGKIKPWHKDFINNKYSYVFESNIEDLKVLINSP